MKPIFGKAPPLGIRLALAVIASMTLILVDGQTSSMTKARSVMETAVGGLYYLANGPRTVLDGVSSNLVDTNKLLIENKVGCVSSCVRKMPIFYYWINSR